MEQPNLADRYFAAMRERNVAGLLSLFAADATVVFPDGRTVGGAGALRQWFTTLFTTAAPSPQPVAVVVGPRGIAVEIETRLAVGNVRRTANFFHLNSDGLIERLSVYSRSG